MNIRNEDPTNNKLQNWAGTLSHVAICRQNLSAAENAQHKAEQDLIKHLVPKDAADLEDFQVWVRLADGSERLVQISRKNAQGKRTICFRPDFKAVAAADKATTSAL